MPLAEDKHGNKLKHCSYCGRWKAVSEFYRNSNFGDGYQTYCKRCTKVKGRRS